MRKLLLTCGLVLGLATPGYAQWVVYDAAVTYRNSVTAALKEWLVRLQQQQHSELRRMAHRLSMFTTLAKYRVSDPPRWRTHDFESPTFLYARDYHAALNYGDASGTAYSGISHSLIDPTQGIGRLPAVARRAMSPRLATVDLAAAAIIAATHDTGRLGRRKMNPTTCPGTREAPLEPGGVMASSNAGTLRLRRSTIASDRATALCGPAGCGLPSRTQHVEGRQGDGTRAFPWTDEEGAKQSKCRAPRSRPRSAIVWSATTFSKNRDRLLAGEIAQAFFAEVRDAAEAAGLLSAEHFIVDGTLLEAYASLKSFQPKATPTPPTDDDPGNPTIDFRGQRRSNQTHQSTTDPDSRLFRKGDGQPSRLAYSATVLMENRHGLVVETRTVPATGTAERDAGLAVVARLGPARGTVGADKGYNQPVFVAGVRGLGKTPHVAEKRRYNAVDGRTTRHPGYAISQRARKRVEEIFGWMKTVGVLRKLRHRGLPRVAWTFTFTAAVYDLVRMQRLGTA